MAAPYTLHGIWLSGPTYKVGLMLAMTGQKFDYENIALREGAHQKPEYRAKSRWGQVPCLTVAATGKNLVQSAAILGYLAQATGKFAGADAHEQQDIREWMLWTADRLGPPVYRSRAAKLGFRAMDPAVVEMYATEGKAVLKTLEAHLTGQHWLVGKAATIADVDAYGVACYATDGGFALTDYPHVQAWMQRFEALPGFSKADTLLPKENKAG
jgi:glutathione S-transferase